MMQFIQFTTAQVAALCGGVLPQRRGFAWETVEYFRYEDGVLQPYAGEDTLPGPSLKVNVSEEGLSPTPLTMSMARKKFRGRFIRPAELNEKETEKLLALLPLYQGRDCSQTVREDVRAMVVDNDNNPSVMSKYSADTTNRMIRNHKIGGKFLRVTRAHSLGQLWVVKYIEPEL